MKRIPEFTLGIIGSIISLLMAGYWFYIFGAMPAIDPIASAGFISNGIGTVIAIVAIVFAALINKTTKASSIILIICAVILFLTNYIQIISSILLLIAGIMGLVRKIK